MSIAQRPGVAACVFNGAAASIIKSTGIVSVVRNSPGVYTVTTRERYSDDSIPMVGPIENDFFAFVEPQVDLRVFIVFTKDSTFTLSDTTWWFVVERIVA